MVLHQTLVNAAVGPALPPGGVSVILRRALGSCYSLEMFIAKKLAGAERGINTLLCLWY